MRYEERKIRSSGHPQGQVTDRVSKNQNKTKTKAKPKSLLQQKQTQQQTQELSGRAQPGVHGPAFPLPQSYKCKRGFFFFFLIQKDCGFFVVVEREKLKNQSNGGQMYSLSEQPMREYRGLKRIRLATVGFLAYPTEPKIWLW